MIYGQLIIGPPGSGKSTYARGMREFLSGLDRRCISVNLDPAVPATNAKSKDDHIDICELVTVQGMMESAGLGPNGALIACMELLEREFDWLLERISFYTSAESAVDTRPLYFIFDCPGQVELFTHKRSLKNIVDRLVSHSQFSLCAVHLVDSFHCGDPYRYISAVLLSMTTMLHFELPHVNVLSKIDLISAFSQLDFNLDFYTEVQDMSRLMELLDSSGSVRFHRLNEALVSLIEDFGLVSFYTLQVEDKRSMGTILRVVDKANGYVFGALKGNQEGNESILEVAARVGDGYLEDVQWAQERYLDGLELEDESIQDK